MENREIKAHKEKKENPDPTDQEDLRARVDLLVLLVSWGQREIQARRDHKE